MPGERKPSLLPSLVLFGLMLPCTFAAFWPPLLGLEGRVWEVLPYVALGLLGALAVVNVLRLHALGRARRGRR
jgi:hypothetical protein